MKTFKSSCGCEIHVIKWSAKANSVTVKSCPLHKAAPALLEAAKEMERIIGPFVCERSSAEMRSAHLAIVSAIKLAEGGSNAA